MAGLTPTQTAAGSWMAKVGRIANVRNANANRPTSTVAGARMEATALTWMGL